MEVVLIILYAIPLLFVFIYSIVQLNLVLLYRKAKTNNIELDSSYHPSVTIQLPLYNEKYVVERLIDCICKLDYPGDKLEIQVLDDSTDESFELAKAKVKEYQSQGVNIIQINRADRKGFKAGALAYGLEKAAGEFVAIFDADFLPEPDFLKKTIPFFKNSKVGVVQTKWSHLNKKHSLLTQLQAFGLDAHFSIEQVGRSEGGHFINFNGTAGVWRKKCIEESGGWSADTLTEDLDLSYRAQLNDWEFKYLESVESPSELPIVMSALKGQQFRWTKGAAECARKNLVKVWSSSKVSFSTKLHATFHLLNSSIFIGILLMSILSVPLLYIKEYYNEYQVLFQIASSFIISLLILIVFYWVSYRSNTKRPNLLVFLLRFPLFLSVSMGLSLHNAIAVIEGFLGMKSPFMRTPKFNIKGDQSKGKRINAYVKKSISVVSFLEFALIFYFGFGIVMAFKYQDFGLLPFHIMLTFGYLFVFTQSAFEPRVAEGD